MVRGTKRGGEQRDITRYHDKGPPRPGTVGTVPDQGGRPGEVLSGVGVYRGTNNSSGTKDHRPVKHTVVNENKII